jgi:heptaprenyl diphosphate synthase
MTSRNKQPMTARRMTGMAILISVALVLSYIERMIPFNMVMPGLKLGLANVVTLIALMYLGFFDVVVIVILRVTMSAIFAGSMMSLFYSLTGGLMSLFSMAIILYKAKDFFSLVGVSVFGAIFHNTGQMLVLSVVTGSMRIGMQWYPYLILAGVATGIVTGFIVKYLDEHVEKLPVMFKN